MKITIKAFASVKDTLGFSERRFDLRESATAQEAVRAAERECGITISGSDSLLYAVNEEYSRADRVLRENDVLALFPPVSGG
ncbi:MAG: MoaD/ThiS family protein [Spirochaetes bacterium]|jgi:molybdopterin converting factor subunit 1|nr:MoaD/ThiS family protein [Spirochaetota bacterium]